MILRSSGLQPDAATNATSDPNIDKYRSIAIKDGLWATEGAGYEIARNTISTKEGIHAERFSIRLSGLLMGDKLIDLIFHDYISFSKVRYPNLVTTPML